LHRRYAEAARSIDRIRELLAGSRLDALIVVGDDQKELYFEDNLPSVLVYYGKTIRNVPRRSAPLGSDWYQRATARYYEADGPRDFSVDAPLARHLIGELVAEEFDISTANALTDGAGEGHAFGFVHKRLMNGTVLPIVPVFLNTYYAPNQPTPRRCYRLGQAIRRAVEDVPGRSAHRHPCVGWAQPLHRRRGSRPRPDCRVARQGCGAPRGLARAQAQGRQLGDPQLDLCRRRCREHLSISAGSATGRAIARQPALAPASASLPGSSVVAGRGP
jgi:hypothetical protein